MSIRTLTAVLCWQFLPGGAQAFHPLLEPTVAFRASPLGLILGETACDQALEGRLLEWGSERGLLRFDQPSARILVMAAPRIPGLSKLRNLKITCANLNGDDRIAQVSYRVPGELLADTVDLFNREYISTSNKVMVEACIRRSPYCSGGLRWDAHNSDITIRHDVFWDASDITYRSRDWLQRLYGGQGFISLTDSSTR